MAPIAALVARSNPLLYGHRSQTGGALAAADLVVVGGHKSACSTERSAVVETVVTDVGACAGIREDAVKDTREGRAVHIEDTA